MPTPLLLVLPTLRALEFHAQAMDTDPPAIGVRNADALSRLEQGALAAAWTGGASHGVIADDAAVQLVVRSDGLVFDYADIGFRLASRRLRDALALAAGEVQFLPVDCADCPPAVRAMDYRWLRPAWTADPFDHVRSDGGDEEVYEGVMADWTPFAPTVRRWRLRLPAPGRPMRVRWRDGFVAPAPLFAVPGLPWMLATAGLAARVAAAGVTDMVFRDVTEDVPPAPFALLPG